MAWAERVRWLDQRFELEADETAFKLHLVRLRRCVTLLGCFSFCGSFAISQALWAMPVMDERQLTLGETIHCFSVFISTILSFILAIASASCPRSSWSWEPFWAFLFLTLSTLLATRWHMIPAAGPSTAMLIVFVVVVLLAALPLRLWLSTNVAVLTFVASFISSWLHAEGSYDVGAGMFFCLFLLPIFYVYESDQRQIVLQESIRTLTPKPLAWTNVLGTGASSPVESRSSLRPGRRGDAKMAVICCRTDFRIEEVGPHEQAFFGEDVSNKELLHFFKGEDRQAVAMVLADDGIHQSVSVNTDFFQGRQMVCRLTPSGLSEPKWLAIFCKAKHAIPVDAEKSKAKLVDGYTQTQEDQKAPVRLPRTSTWTSSRTIQVTGIEKGGASCPTTYYAGGREEKGKRKAATLPVRTNRSRSPSIDGEGLTKRDMRDISEFDNQVSLDISLSRFSQVNQGDHIPNQSSSLPLMRKNRLSIDDCRDGGRSLSYSFSLSARDSGSNNSKAVRTDATTQTDLVWNNLGWHCRACAKPPRPQGPHDPPPEPSSSRRSYPPFSAVKYMQGGWTLVRGPVGVAEWLQEFLIVGTTVHSKSHHFPLLLGTNDSVQMAGGAVTVLADGSLKRVGKSGHCFYFQRSDDIDVEAPMDDDEEDDIPQVPHLQWDVSVHSVRIS